MYFRIVLHPKRAGYYIITCTEDDEVRQWSHAIFSNREVALDQLLLIEKDF